MTASVDITATLTECQVEIVKLRQCSKFCGDWSNRRDFSIFNMAGVRHLGFVMRVWATHEGHLVVFITAQKMVGIGELVSII